MQRLKTISADYFNPEGSELVEMGRRGKGICENIKIYDK
jgi:hypothetical protein